MQMEDTMAKAPVQAETVGIERQAYSLPVLDDASFPTRVLKDVSVGVLVLNLKGSIVYTNPPAERMLELSGDSIPDKGSHYSLISSSPDNDDFFDYILNAVQNKGVTHVGMVRFTAPSGRKYVFRMSSSFLRPADGDTNPEPQIVVTMDDETTADEMRRKSVDSSRCFVISTSCICVWILIYALWEMLGRPISVDYLTHGTEIMGLIMMVLVFRYTSFTWKDLGVTASEPKKTVVTALIVSAGAVGLLVLIRLIARLFDPTLFAPEAPFVDFSRFTWHEVSYVFTAGIQEFIARGVIQTNIRRIMVGKRPVLTAIILSALIFAALHIQHGFLFMVGAGILGGLEGILYEKQQNILGVWILHWIFGVSGTLLCLIAVAH